MRRPRRAVERAKQLGCETSSEFVCSGRVASTTTCLTWKLGSCWMTDQPRSADAKRPFGLHKHPWPLWTSQHRVARIAPHPTVIQLQIIVGSTVCSKQVPVSAREPFFRSRLHKNSSRRAARPGIGFPIQALPVHRGRRQQPGRR